MEFFVRITFYVLRITPTSCRLHTDDLGDLDAEPVFNDDNFTVGDAFLVHVKIDGRIGNLVELDHGAGIELQDIPHRHLAGAELYGHLDRHIEQDFEIRGSFHIRSSSNKGRW